MHVQTSNARLASLGGGCSLTFISVSLWGAALIGLREGWQCAETGFAATVIDLRCSSLSLDVSGDSAPVGGCSFARLFGCYIPPKFP